MEPAKVLNYLDVNNLVSNFLIDRKQGIETIHRIYFKDNNTLSIKAFLSSLEEELKTGCITFINKNESLDDLNTYLFYIVNAHAKKLSIPIIKKKTEYLCPGCLFLGKENILNFGKIFECDNCKDDFKNTQDIKQQVFYKTFYKHNKSGYRCDSCDRFIPHPLDNITTIICPYFDCCFVGNINDLKKMNHPTSQTNPEKLILDSTKHEKLSIKDTILSNEIDAHSSLEIKEDILNKIKILNEIISTQSDHLSYSSSGFTLQHKLSIYQAFNKLLVKFPIEMVDYLLHESRSGGFQHKIFQEYIKILEDSFPFIIKKNNKMVRIDNLLDSNLSLFDGISTFDGLVNDNGIVKNNTSEYYIGGRKAAYTKPYYIGKLLNIVDKKNKEPLLHLVKEYSFSKIKLKDVVPGTEVTVMHLRIPPHYQMGGMVYVNRIRKKIVDRAQLLFKKENNV